MTGRGIGPIGNTRDPGGNARQRRNANIGETDDILGKGLVLDSQQRMKLKLSDFGFPQAAQASSTFPTPASSLGGGNVTSNYGGWEDQGDAVLEIRDLYGATTQLVIDHLQEETLPDIRNAFATIINKQNKILAALRSVGILED